MSIPKLIEDAVTILLREELEKRGVKALPVSIRTPQGHRKPDLLCENAGIYPIEAKFRENDLTKAIAKIQNDYIKFYKYLGIKGGFAILYPEELSKPMPLEAAKDLAYKLKFKVVEVFPPEDKRNFNVYEGSLIEVADEIAKHVLTPPEYVEPSVEYIIKVLRDSATYITEALKHLTGKQLEDLFGGKHVFKNILQYEEGKYPVESLRLASAYLLVNQLLFYHVLSRRIPRKFPELDPDTIEHPADLNKYFKKVLDVNYRAVLSYDVASRIPQKYLDQVKMIVNVIQGLSPEKIGGDLLGTIFHDLVPFEVRKTVAAFYTNVLVAELLAWLAIDKYDAKVADFACGSGGLLVASYRRKRFLLEQERPFTQEDHRRFVEEELLGVDVMPFAANVAACHLALQSPQYFTNKVNIAIWDSTELSPGRVIPSIAGLKFVLAGQTNLEMFTKSGPEVKGVVSLTGEKPEEIELETYDVVIMNPPFTRQERIPKEYKDKLFERFKNYKDYLHGQLGYFGYFILLADKFTTENGRIALVLPATILRIRSCEGLRRLLAERYHVEYIVTTWFRSAFSESARFREILLVARKGKADAAQKTAVVILKKLPETLEEARKIAEIVKKAKQDWEDDKLIIRVYNYEALRTDPSDWFKYISAMNRNLIKLRDELLEFNKLVLFSELLDNLEGKVLEGIESRRGGKVQILTISRPERAIKKEDVWVIIKDTLLGVESRDKLSRRRLFIPNDSLRKALRRISLVSKIDLTDQLDYVLVKGFEGEDEYFKAFLKKAKPPSWDRWCAYVEDRLTYLALLRRGDLSAPGTCVLAFYSEDRFAPPGVAWAIKLSKEDSKILCLWFNSTLNLLQMLLERKETRGAFLQIDKYVLEELKVPNIKDLSKEEKMLLLNVFENVRREDFPSILDQLRTKHPARKLIDETWLRIFGYSDDIDITLDELYNSVATEIELLKKLMKEARKTSRKENEEKT